MKTLAKIKLTKAAMKVSMNVAMNASIKAVFSLIIFCFFFINISSLASAEQYIVENPRPIITISFDEPILDIVVSLKTYSTGINIPLNKIAEDSEHKLFQFQPIQDLIHGESYTFRAIGYDAGGKPGLEKRIDFIVQVPPLRISYYQPKHGVSQTETFDFSVQTDRQAIDCRYSVAIRRLYQDMSAHFVTDTSKLIHTTANINVPEGLSPVYYVACNDTYGIVNDEPYQLVLSVDTTNPILQSAYADPNEIIYYTSDGLRTDFKITADEQVLCKASKNTVDYYAMEKYFEGYNSSNSKAYKTTGQRNITGSADGDGGQFTDNTTYSFNVICENLAERISNLKQVNFTVDLNKALRITNAIPGNNPSTQEEELEITIMTNKASDCFYGPTQQIRDSKTLPFGGAGTTSHSKIIGNALSSIQLNQGSNPVYVLCSYFSETTTTDIHIIYDTTEPEAGSIYANITNQTGSNIQVQWQRDSINAIIGAEDPESGIAGYNYTLLDSQDNVIYSGSAAAGITQNIRITGLNLTDGESYYLSVKVRNNAGLWSDELSSDEVQIDISTIPAEADKCDNGILDTLVGETDVDCGGTMCSLCKEGKSCSIDNDCVNGLNCLEGLCKKPDEQCGADLARKCPAGEGCIAHNDCLSGFCSDNICAQPSCFDGVINQDETAADCGGATCDLCKTGFTCLRDSDCKSDNCVASENENAPKTCAGKQAGASCETNEECESNFCDNIKKECVKDSDNDGLPDYWETQFYQDEFSGIPDDDTDGDGFTNLQEYIDGTDPTNIKDHKKTTCAADTDCNPGFICDVSKSCEKDSDGNNIPDWWEMKYFSCTDCVEKEGDDDGDKLKNYEEYLKGTNPDLKDTDGDGYDDYVEVQAGTDPTDETEHPTSNLGLILAIIAGLIVIGVGGYFGYKYISKKKADLNAGLMQQQYAQGTSGQNFGGTSQQAGTQNQFSTQQHSTVDLHKVFVEKQKVKQEKMVSMFDAFEKKDATMNQQAGPEQKDKDFYKTGKKKMEEAFSDEAGLEIAEKPLGELGENQEGDEFGEEGTEKESALSLEQTEKQTKKKALFDKLSSLSTKQAKTSRLDELSAKKSAGSSLDKLTKKPSGKSRLDEIGKGKKSSLDELAKS
ncbi:MAG: hypothetical protein Q8O89_08235, partial [Nanoarchaeota archaeon]|nr:hypothetical protein [Nanoarchaeota archaeon]